MAEEQDQASKTEEATPKKLQDARKKGDVAKTADVAPLMAMTFSFMVLAIGGTYLARRMAEGMLPFVARPHDIPLDSLGGVMVLKQAAAAAAPVLLVVTFTAAAGGFLGNVIQHGFLWTGEKVKPDLKKLSPIKGMKRLFGIDGWVQFFKSVLKILAVGFLAWWILNPRFSELPGAALMDPAGILPTAVGILRALFIAVIAFMALTAGADFLWQRYRFLERMKMSRDELKQEHKSTEGDPLIKAKQRQMRMERSRRRMIQAVPTATVVIMNPTHYAVALLYEPGETAAPKCVAKGLDTLALKIREVAEASQVPVIEDAPLARALYAAIEVDEEIPTAHYEAVAKIIGFVMNKGKKRPQTVARPMRG
jgi:flagellar biosynthetic protein FlhB